MPHGLGIVDVASKSFPNMVESALVPPQPALCNESYFKLGKGLMVSGTWTVSVFP